MVPKQKKVCRCAFTLIELLVVIAIIAMLLAIIMPSLSRAKESARLVLCRNNLHQWAVAIESWAIDHDDVAPLSTTYQIAADKVTQSFPNEMYLDQYNGQLNNVFGPNNSAQAKKWQKKMISHESIGPYLPGFNDKGLRTTNPGSPANFVNSLDNWVLDGVWKCPSQKKDRENDLKFVLATLTGKFGGSRSWFRVDYTYFGRSDLWADSMIPDTRDKNSIVGKYPASGRVMLADSVAIWGSGGGAPWYNHGSGGPSYDNPTDTNNRLLYTKPAELITGMNEAYGDGSVQWKKIDSDDRFRLTDAGPFDSQNNRHMDTGLDAFVYY